MNGSVSIAEQLSEFLVKFLREHRRVAGTVLFFSILVIAALAALLAIPYLIISNEVKIFGFVGILFSLYLIALVLVSLLPPSKTGKRVDQERIERAESKVESEPEKVRPAWDLARLTLEAYFNRNLSQITYIFWLSVGAMLAGFGAILWGIYQAIQSPNTITPALIAAATGVITEFIGATFLFIYRSTIEQAINYSRTLERINSVGMAMQILDTMSDVAKANDLKSKTKARLVELLVQQANGISENQVSRQDINAKSNAKK